MKFNKHIIYIIIIIVVSFGAGISTVLLMDSPYPIHSIDDVESKAKPIEQHATSTVYETKESSKLFLVDHCYQNNIHNPYEDDLKIKIIDSKGEYVQYIFYNYDKKEYDSEPDSKGQIWRDSYHEIECE